MIFGRLYTKRSISLILALIAVLVASGCIHQPPQRPFETSERPTREPGETAAREQPLYLTEPVDVTQEFEKYTAIPVNTPWVLEKSIPFSHGDTPIYFAPFVTDEAHSGVIPGSETYNNDGIVYTPIVRHYPAEEDGYTVYEITYSIELPLCMFVPNGYDVSYYWQYHDVQYLDYYTGMEYPEFNTSSAVKSFCTYGDVVYNGQTYTVYHYSYREREVSNRAYAYSDAGRTVDLTVTYDVTDYFIIPNGYDGIVMYIYTADDSDISFEEAYESNTADYSEYTFFGENGERIEDYTFINICETG